MTPRRVHPGAGIQVPERVGHELDIAGGLQPNLRETDKRGVHVQLQSPRAIAKSNASRSNRTAPARTQHDVLRIDEQPASTASLLRRAVDARPHGRKLRGRQFHLPAVSSKPTTAQVDARTGSILQAAVRFQGHLPS